MRVLTKSHFISVATVMTERLSQPFFFFFFQAGTEFVHIGPDRRQGLTPGFILPKRFGIGLRVL